MLCYNSCDLTHISPYCPHRLAVRTPAFQAGCTGSIPVGGTNFSRGWVRSSVVEHSPFKRRVMGSNPIGPSNATFLKDQLLRMTLHDIFTTEHNHLRKEMADLESALSSNSNELETRFLALQKSVREHLHKEDAVYYPYV